MLWPAPPERLGPAIGAGLVRGAGQAASVRAAGSSTAGTERMVALLTAMYSRADTSAPSSGPSTQPTLVMISTNAVLAVVSISPSTSSVPLVTNPPIIAARAPTAFPRQNVDTNTGPVNAANSV